MSHVDFLANPYYDRLYARICEYQLATFNPDNSDNPDINIDTPKLLESLVRYHYDMDHITLAMTYTLINKLSV